MEIHRILGRAAGCALASAAAPRLRKLLRVSGMGNAHHTTRGAAVLYTNGSMFDKARTLLNEFKSGCYLHGFDVLGEAGRGAAGLGRRALLVRDAFPGGEAFVSTIV